MNETLIGTLILTIGVGVPISYILITIFKAVLDSDYKFCPKCRQYRSSTIFSLYQRCKVCGGKFETEPEREVRREQENKEWNTEASKILSLIKCSNIKLDSDSVYSIADEDENKVEIGYDGVITIIKNKEEK